MDATPSPSRLLPALIETYLARCAVEGKSPRTIQAYREALSRFRSCLGGRPPVPAETARPIACCDGSAGLRGSDGCTPTASATPSRPG